MTVLIDNVPQGLQTRLTYQSNAIRHRPIMGGPDQVIARMGGRWVLEVQLRTFKYDLGIGLAAKLTRGTTEKLLFPVPQYGLDIGNPGNPTITSGAGQSIVVTGFTPGYTIRAGQFFSLVHNGVRYLHQVVSEVTATGGTANLGINPGLKVTPNSGSACEFAQPYIEGFLAEPAQTYSFGLNNGIAMNCVIVEAQ